MSISTKLVGQRRLQRILEKTLSLAGETAVVLVANVAGQTLITRDLPETSHSAQFYKAAELDDIITRLRQWGFFVRLFDDETPFFEAVLKGEIQRLRHRHKLVYNMAECGTGPGRKALIPSFCNYYGLPYCNSNPHANTLARHKFHGHCLARQFGLQTPNTWMFDSRFGWIMDSRPTPGTKVIAKPTHECACVGVQADSVFLVDGTLDERISELEAHLGQPVTVQEFIAGYEVGVPILEVPEPFAPAVVGYSIDGNKQFGEKFRTYQDENFSERFGHYLFDVFSLEHEVALKTQALAAFQILGLRGLARMDFRVNDEGEGYITDMNESPPPLDDTAFVFALKSLGFSYSEVLVQMVGVSMLREGWI